MSDNEKRTKECCTCITSTICIGFALAVMFIGIESANILGAEKSECLISNVTYPTSLPTTSSKSNFVSCDCGKNCNSDIGYCVRVFVDYRKDTYLAGLSNDPVKGCTYAETNCPDGEKISSRLKALQAAATIAEPYIIDMNNSLPITCYINEDTVFLIDDTENIIILLSVLGGLSIVFLIIACLCNK